MEIKLNELNLNKSGIVKQINCSDNIKTRLVDYYLTRKGRLGCDCRYV